MKKNAIFAAALAFFCAAAALAQQPPEEGATANFRSTAPSLQLTVNPFNAEALKIYELRRKAERLELEGQTSGVVLQDAPSSKAIEELVQVDTEILERLGSLEDAVTDVRQALSSGAGEAGDAGGWETPESSASAEKETFPRPNPDAVYYGVISFGNGLRALYYEDDIFRRADDGDFGVETGFLRHAGVGEFAPKAIINKDGFLHAEVNRVGEDRVFVGHRGIPYAREYPVLYEPPEAPQLGIGQ